MTEYIERIIILYVNSKRNELKLPSNQLALAILNVFRGQQTQSIMDLLEENNILVINIASNSTDRLQPMDLSINKMVKDFIEANAHIGILNKSINSLLMEKRLHQWTSRCLR